MKFLSILFLTLTVSLSALADFSKCSYLFPKGKAPAVSSQVNKTSKELCSQDFAVLYSVVTKTPVYVVEKLNYLRMGNKEPRTNKFREDIRLNKSERSTLADYAKSGWDRGHLAPAADMNNPLAMSESFVLSNIAPQAEKFNRGVWAKNVEIPTRKYVARASGDVFVFTGVYYNSSNYKTIGKSNVGVPDYFWKLVYDSQTKKSWVYWLENSNDVKMSKPLTYEEFVKKTGLKLLD